MRALLRALALPLVPVAILAAGFALVFYGAALPRSLAGFTIYSPHILFALGMALAIGYGRGRAVFALLVLATAYAARQWWLQEGVDGFHARAVYAALTIFVPLDLALLSVLPERGGPRRQPGLLLLSTMITSAPRSERCLVVRGPVRCQVKSITLISSSSFFSIFFFLLPGWLNDTGLF